MSFDHLTPSQLLGQYAQISEELRTRGLVRSANNPAGDYAEYLFCLAFGWEQAAKSVKSFDAIEPSKGQRFQIKSRRLTKRNGSRQLSAMRRLDVDCFDYLAAVLFTEDFGIHRAAIIPHSFVLRNSKYVEHTNSWRFILRDTMWDESGVIDVTSELHEVVS